MSQPSVSREVARTAANWLSRLHSGEASYHDQQACMRWRQADPEHERAWLRAEALQKSLGLIPPKIGMKTLDREERYARRKALKMLALLIVAGPIAYGSYKKLPWQQYAADYQTAIGEQKYLTLADGTKLSLNTATSVEVDFTKEQRVLNLYRGEILVETGKDILQRPLLIKTGQGLLQPIGTRFIVRQLDDVIRLSVLQGQVEVQPLQGDSQRVPAGKQAEFTRDNVIDIRSSLQGQADAWRQGVLYANDMPLSAFVKELSRYRNGVMRCEPAVANLRISGVFQIDNTDYILAALPDTLPVEVSSVMGLWVTIKARES